jgi:parallel beta-helix repeat protein
MKTVFVLGGAAFALAMAAPDARAEVINCTTINTLPTVIGVQGVYCLKGDLATSMTSGNAILVNTNNVIIDLNGFKLGGLAGGPNTTANGIAAYDRQNITIRNGSIRGFVQDVVFLGGSGHIVEDMRIEGARSTGIRLSGSRMIARDNFITTTGDGVTTGASGIYVDSAIAFSITGNVVSNVSETAVANGIRLENATQSVIEGNEVHAIVGQTGNGIYVGDGTRNVIRKNVVTADSATTGIAAWSSGDACIDNAVSASFTTPLAGCEVSRNNDVF